MSSVNRSGDGNSRLGVCVSLRTGEKGLLKPLEQWGLLSSRKVIQLLVILRPRREKESSPKGWGGVQ